MAPTDGEEGEVLRQGFPAERDLEAIPLRDDPRHRLVGRLAVEPGVDVGPAREQQRVEALEQDRGVFGRARSQDQGQPAGRLHRPHVVVPQREDLAAVRGVADRDPDQGPPHILSGTGMPRRAMRTSIWRRKASTSIVRKARRSSLSAWRTEYRGFW